MFLTLDSSNNAANSFFFIYINTTAQIILEHKCQRFKLLDPRVIIISFYSCCQVVTQIMTLSRNLLWVSISSIFRTQSIMNCFKSLPIWSIFYHIWLIYSFVFNWLLVRLNFFPNIVWHFAFFFLYLFPWSTFILHILFLMLMRSILCIIHCCVPNIFSKFVIGLVLFMV